MDDRSTKAFLLSLTLHGLVVGLFFLFSYNFNPEPQNNPKVFELVAGPGDNYAATAAPAEGGPDVGSPDTVKFNAPPTPAPTIQTAPPEPAPVIETAPEPAPTKPTPAKAEPKPVEPKAPNFSRDVERIARKREHRLIEAERKKREAAERKAQAEAAKQQKMTLAEFQKKYGKQANPAGRTSGGSLHYRPVDLKGVAGGTGSAAGAGGKALTREEQDLLDGYIALLLQRLREAHEKPPGVSDLLQAKVQFHIAADGTLSSVKITRSSGNSDFDQSVLAAFARVHSIGPTPTGKGDTWEVTFKMSEGSD